MRKTDLVIGETYAVHTRPVHHKSWGVGRPYKVTLVALSGTVTLKEQKTVRRETGHVYTDSTKEHGILVELDEPLTRERDEYVLGRGYGKESEAALAVLKTSVKVTDTITQRALKNAGCFVSTWADYEAKVARDAELEKARAAQTQAAIEKEEAEAADAEEQVILARRKLIDAFGDERVVSTRENWRGATYRYGDYTQLVTLSEKLGNWVKRPVDAEITISVDALNSLTIGEKYVEAGEKIRYANSDGDVVVEIDA